MREAFDDDKWEKKGFWLLLALASSSSSSSDISFFFFFRFSIGDKELGFGSSFPWRMLCAEEDEMKERENLLVHDDQEKRRVFCWAERERYHTWTVPLAKVSMLVLPDFAFVLPLLYAILNETESYCQRLLCTHLLIKEFQRTSPRISLEGFETWAGCTVE